jgi:hypothetical protein
MPFTFASPDSVVNVSTMIDTRCGSLPAFEQEDLRSRLAELKHKDSTYRQSNGGGLTETQYNDLDSEAQSLKSLAESRLASATRFKPTKMEGTASPVNDLPDAGAVNTTAKDGTDKPNGKQEPAAEAFPSTSRRLDGMAPTEPTKTIPQLIRDADDLLHSYQTLDKIGTFDAENIAKKLTAIKSQSRDHLSAKQESELNHQLQSLIDEIRSHND